MMELAELNARVTEAILRAERLPATSLEAQSAFREVSLLEEAIAANTSSSAIEGEIARLGAVSAAIKAGEYLRALQLGLRYEDDMQGVKVRARLRQLLEDAEHAAALAATTATC